MQRKYQQIPSKVVLVLTVLLVILATSIRPLVTLADMAGSPSLVISQLKITSSNGQFITLYNNTDATLDMSRYQVEYFNNYDLSKATSSRLISLTGSLPAHGYYMLNDDSLLLCYQVTVNSQSLGFSSTAGMVQILALSQAVVGQAAMPVLQDYVGWSKTAASGAQTLPTNTANFLQRQPVDARYNPAITAAGVGSWQIVQRDTANPCNLATVVSGASGSPVATGMNQLLPASEPPATFVVTDDSPDGDSTSQTASLPASDVGLMAPKITEVLPNPLGTGNDAQDEFIELYNPNSVDFDLTGFSLQTGITTTHSFKFPTGSSLPALGFSAYFPPMTGLSLSNSGGQAGLLDPFGSTITSSDVYGTAKDGQAWALGNGVWQWTLQPTPGAANVIQVPAASKKKSSKASTKSKSSKASSAAINGKKATVKAASNSAFTGDDNASKSPIHIWTLALVAGLALVYGLYEYRADLANYGYQLRRKLGDRRATRESLARRRSD